MAVANPLSLQLVSEARGPLPVRVLFFDHTAALGGGEIALANLVSHLDPKRVKPIVVLAAEGPLADRLRPTTETYVLPLSVAVTGQKKDSLGFASLFRVREAVSVFRYVRQLARLMRSHNVAIVHTNSLKADIIGGIAGRLARLPVVWHVRDRIEDDYLPKCVVRAFRGLARVIPNYVIANSAATLRSLHPRKGTSNTSVIPSGCKLWGRSAIVHDGTAPAALAERTELRQESHVGLVGRISPWKGQHIFIQAAALVHQDFPDARFFIIGSALFGEDSYDQEIRRLPGQLGIESIVKFTGFRSDVDRAIAELDLVVHASTKGEPFGQVIIEAMAAGKPVVATNGGGVPEIVEDGRTGILVPMGDAQAMAQAICRILSNPVGAKAMGRQGRKRVADHFTLQQTARRVEAAYAKVLQCGTGGNVKVRDVV
jgi:glycosyltransferase involved in cell wall biosynthesis